MNRVNPHPLARFSLVALGFWKITVDVLDLWVKKVPQVKKNPSCYVAAT